MAVPTRSRAAAEGVRKSILRFPNEILSMVIEHSSTLELWALCRTSKRLRSIATPFLYRNIHLYSAEQTLLFIRTMQSQASESSEPLWLRVQEFVIANDNALVGATSQIIDDLTSVVIKMTKLKHLLLSSKTFIDFTHLLQSSNFRYLQTFRYVLQPTPSSTDSEEFFKFLARHRATLTTLCIECQKPITLAHSIDLPLLHTYDGPSWALKFLKKSVGSLRSVVLRWKEPDIDYRSPLKQLSKAHSIQTLEIVVDTFPGRLREPTILAAVAQSVPHVQILRFSRSALYGFSFDDLMPMRQHLSRFTALSELRFAIFRRESVSAVNDDLPILDAWLRVCGTLCLVHLDRLTDGVDWRLVDGAWIPSG
ncbi:hypothetical protein R3P38DRAFT_3616870 [Favolaschia claudopus]|uniref:F-box domain-containing protein n=1 Tax=Favolaschia claudopus TaxID=2862362 RepID=A0AAW0A2M7_9AGAR